MIHNGRLTIRLNNGFVIAATPEGGVVRHAISLQPIHQLISTLEDEYLGLPLLVYGTSGPPGRHGRIDGPLGRHGQARVVGSLKDPPNFALTKKRGGGPTLLVVSGEDRWTHGIGSCEDWPGMVRIHQWDGHAFVQIREHLNP